MNKVQCQALANAFKATPDILDSIVFENCGLDDESCSIIMDGLISLNHVNSLTFKNQELSEGNISKFGKIMEKSFPY